MQQREGTHTQRGAVGRGGGETERFPKQAQIIRIDPKPAKIPRLHSDSGMLGAVLSADLAGPFSKDRLSLTLEHALPIGLLSSEVFVQQ